MVGLTNLQTPDSGLQWPMINFPVWNGGSNVDAKGNYNYVWAEVLSAGIMKKVVEILSTGHTCR